MTALQHTPGQSTGPDDRTGRTAAYILVVALSALVASVGVGTLYLWAAPGRDFSAAMLALVTVVSGFSGGGLAATTVGGWLGR